MLSVDVDQYQRSLSGTAIFLLIFAAEFANLVWTLHELSKAVLAFHFHMRGFDLLVLVVVLSASAQSLVSLVFLADVLQMPTQQSRRRRLAVAFAVSYVAAVALGRLGQAEGGADEVGRRLAVVRAVAAGILPFGCDSLIGRTLQPFSAQLGKL